MKEGVRRTGICSSALWVHSIDRPDVYLGGHALHDALPQPLCILQAGGEGGIATRTRLGRAHLSEEEQKLGES